MDTIIDKVNYGPLAMLIGRWVGNKGNALAPEPDGSAEHNEYTDELIFSAAGPAENAEEQQLVAVKYHHVVRKNANGQIFHDQIGHWIYEPSSNTVMHSLSIPRGVCLLAGGTAEKQTNGFSFEVSAKAGSESYGIVQSPFMLEKAKTKAFDMVMEVNGDQLSYKETMLLEIYGKEFEHIDQSILQRVVYDT